MGRALLVTVALRSLDRTRAAGIGDIVLTESTPITAEAGEALGMRGLLTTDHTGGTGSWTIWQCAPCHPDHVRINTEGRSQAAVQLIASVVLRGLQWGYFFNQTIRRIDGCIRRRDGFRPSRSR